MEHKTDAELVELTRERGDRTAFGELVRRYQGHAYGLAYSILGDWAEAEDMAQEAFIRAYVNLHQLQDPAKFPAWLRRIAFSTCMNWLKAFRPQLYRSMGEPADVDQLDIIPDPKGATPLSAARDREMSQVVLAAIDELPPKYRIPLTMFHLDGLSYEKVAEFLEIPLGTAKSLISRARKKLKPALQSYAEEAIPMVKEVFNEHKLTEEFGQKVLRGVETTKWGMEAPQQNSVMASLAAAFEVIGDPVSHEYLMGVSGAAFRLQVGCMAAAPHANCGFNCQRVVLDALERRVDFLPVDIDDPQSVGRAREAIIESIDDGRPVLGGGGEESALILGYEDEGRAFLIRGYNEKTDGYRSVPQGNWGIGVIGKEKRSVDRRQALLRSLRIAVEVANTEKFGGYISGFAAYEAWISDLLGEFTMSRSGPENAWCYTCLLDARIAAAAYLRTIAPEFDAQAAGHLVEATELYDAIVAILRDGLPNAPYPWQLKGADCWSMDVRRGLASTLKDALAAERDAISQIERALGSTG